MKIAVVSAGLAFLVSILLTPLRKSWMSLLLRWGLLR